MMFDRTQEARLRAERFGKTLDELCAQLAPWPEEAAAVQELRDAYTRKSRTFFEEEHLFSLAVIGQVKAGKSTFLNALLFGGQSLLPQAASPKTAVLTRLEYAPETSLTVEYYTEEDWELLRRSAAVPLESPTARGAREILRAAEGMEEERVRCAAKGTEVFPCPGEDALAELLEDTAGGRGVRSPFVKCVTLGLCREELRGVSVVDTPGLNDPVLSRSQRTREFLEVCDAAFFLSHSGYFLDENDLALLCAQLPQKGVRRLLLVGSRFDGALADVRAAEGPVTAEDVRHRLAGRAAGKLDEVVRTLQRRGVPQPVLEVIRDCREPLFVSPVAHRMADKSPADYTPAEQAVAACLFDGPPDPEELRRLGNMEEARRQFDRFAAEKDATLASKADSFAAVSQTELRDLLDRLCSHRRARGETLRAAERQAMERSARLAEDARRITAQTAQLFDAYLQPLEGLLDTARAALEEMGRASPAPAERTDVTLRSEAQTISDTVLWKPWTWGHSHREYSVQQTTHSYWEVGDTVEFLKEFPREFSLLWDGIYAPMTDTARLHNRLMMYARTALTEIGCPEQGDAVPEMVRRALSHLYPPRLTLGTEALRTRLQTRFPSRACDPASRAALEEGCREAVQEALAAARRELDEGARRFERTVRAAQEDFCAQLLAPVSAQRRELEGSLDGIRRERAHCQEFEETVRRLA